MNIMFKLLEVRQVWTPPADYRNVIVLGFRGSKLELEASDELVAALLKEARQTLDREPEVTSEVARALPPEVEIENFDLRTDLDPAPGWKPEDPLAALRARAAEHQPRPLPPRTSPTVLDNQPAPDDDDLFAQG